MDDYIFMWVMIWCNVNSMLISRSDALVFFFLWMIIKMQIWFVCWCFAMVFDSMNFCGFEGFPLKTFLRKIKLKHQSRGRSVKALLKRLELQFDLLCSHLYYFYGFGGFNHGIYCSTQDLNLWWKTYFQRSRPYLLRNG